MKTIFLYLEKTLVNSWNDLRLCNFMILLAKWFCWLAHFGQKRAYTGEPYFYHSYAVVEIIKSYPHTKSMLSAAYLHDTVEDVWWVKSWLIRLIFGKEVESIVAGLTNKSKLTDGSRKIRKQIDLIHLSQCSYEVQTVKLADVFDNCKNISSRDKKFAVIYLKEKIELLRHLNKADYALLTKVNDLIINELKGSVK